MNTIAAISTPQGRGGIAVIRISGPEAFAVADRVFQRLGKGTLGELAGGRIVYGHFFSDGRMIDDGMAAVFHAPHSFTGEDTVELNCHGGLLLTQTLLGAVFAAGAEPAGPGEFTRRAFLSGKLSLTQAEAIGNLIDAESREKIFLSASQAGGALSQRIRVLYDRLRGLVASAYASIDFPDEDLAELTPEEMRETLRELQTDLQRLCDSYRAGRAISEGIPTVLAGRPNTGKSSLLNLLMGKERAIVSDRPGTTRDTIEETVSLGRVLLRLCDTAGLRETGDDIERLGVARAEQKLREASLVLAVFDASQPCEEADLAFLSLLQARQKEAPECVVLPILNKSDLPAHPHAPDPEAAGLGKPVVLSAAQDDGSGLAALSRRVEELFMAGLPDQSEAIVTSARQHAALQKAQEALACAADALDRGLGTDLAGLDLEQALAALGESDGLQVSEEVVNEIFSHFCVGK